MKNRLGTHSNQLFRRNSPAGRLRRGFTLIELLLVLVILAILALVVVVKLNGRVLQAQTSAAKTDISNFKVALGMYEIDNGGYPNTQQGLAALVENPGNLPNWKHAYIEKLPKDPWGHDYIYRSPGTGNKDYDLFSCGPDGNEGGGDDID